MTATRISLMFRKRRAQSTNAAANSVRFDNMDDDFVEMSFGAGVGSQVSAASEKDFSTDSIQSAQANNTGLDDSFDSEVFEENVL